jgi:hypothetical protein
MTVMVTSRMPVLDLSKLDKILQTYSTSVTSATHHIIEKYGNITDAKFMGVKCVLGIDVDNWGNTFIAVPNVEWTNPLALEITTQHKDAFIAHVRAAPGIGLSGSFLMKFALTLLRAMGVHRVMLQDAAYVSKRVEDPKHIVSGRVKCEFSLSRLLMISDKTSFYGKFGFRPSKKSLTRTLCRSADRVRNIKLSEIMRLASKISNAVRVIDDELTAESSIPKSKRRPAKAAINTSRNGIPENALKPAPKNPKNATLSYFQPFIKSNVDKFDTLKSLSMDLDRHGDVALKDVVKKTLSCENQFCVETVLSIVSIVDNSGRTIFKNPYATDFERIGMDMLVYELDLRKSTTHEEFC